MSQTHAGEDEEPPKKEAKLADKDSGSPTTSRVLNTPHYSLRLPLQCLPSGTVALFCSRPP